MTGFLGTQKIDAKVPSRKEGNGKVGAHLTRRCWESFNRRAFRTSMAGTPANVNAGEIPALPADISLDVRQRRGGGRVTDANKRLMLA